MKAVYSSSHYKKIAAALNKPVESVMEYVARFEEEASWYLRFEANAGDPERSPAEGAADCKGRA